MIAATINWLRGMILATVALACTVTTVAARPIPPYAYDICIKPAGGAVIDGVFAVATLERAYRIAQAHPTWPSGLPKSMPKLEFDCDFQPAAFGPNVVVAPTSDTWQSSTPGFRGPRALSKTNFGTVVVVLPREEIERLFWSRDYSGFATTTQRTLGEEEICQGHVCFTTTSAHYLMPTEAADSELLARWILGRFGRHATAESVRDAAVGIPPVEPPTARDDAADWIFAPFAFAMLNVVIVGAVLLLKRTGLSRW